MGQIIQMPVMSNQNKSKNKVIGKNTKQKNAIRKNQQKYVDNGLNTESAKILFFTGVRYERIVQCTSIQ